MNRSAPLLAFEPPARVLLVTNLKDLDETLPFTIRFASVPEAHVEIFHALPGLRYVEPINSGETISLAAVISHAEHVLENAARVARDQGLVCHWNLRRGELARVLGDAMEGYWPDRIIVGSFAHDDSPSEKSSSVVEFVLRESAVPVYVVRRPPHSSRTIPDHSETRILFATRLDRESLDVAQYVLHCAKAYNAELTMLHVIDAPPDSGDWTTQVRRYADRHFETLRSQLKKDTIPCRVEEGPIAETVCRVAQEGNFDLLLIGSVSGASFRGDILPGNASRIVRHAPCPVLVLKRPEATYLESAVSHDRPLLSPTLIPQS